MKVFGKEKDFYDSALDYTNREQETWFREFKIFKLNKTLEKEMPDKYSQLLDVVNCVEWNHINSTISYNNKTELFKPDAYTSNLYIGNGFILFAGKFYPFIKISDNEKHSEVFYDSESFFKRMEALDLSEELEYREKRYYYFDKFRRLTLREKVERTFEIDSSKTDLNILHIKLNNPILICDFLVNKKLYKDSHFVLDSGGLFSHNFNHIIESGRLNDYQFIKVFDPHTFVQELEMFMGNVLIKRDPEPVFTDKDKIHSHGFDNKTSFRKGKTKKSKKK